MRNLKADILALAADDLEEIEQALRHNLNTYLDLVEKVAGHILFSGGKRFRPLLMVLSARLCGYKGSYDKTFSVIFEYLHAATLLHDDLVDEAAIRRGKPAANTVYGNAAAVLVGDFLLARSLSIAAATGKIEVIQSIGAITEDMSQGEIHQLISKGNIHLSEDQYIEVIRRKTAALIQGACHTGALVAGAPPDKTAALADFGLKLGMAFQMADDLLDYLADSKILGKEIGADLREGKMTLPLIYSLRKASPENRRRMESIITHGNPSHQELVDLIQLLETYGGIDYTRRLAADYVTAAKTALALFQPSETRDLLFLLADYTLMRRD
ncbi:MAG: polyprenyl synthetase family protein [Thermodesulfobacteriota bacterium]